MNLSILWINKVKCYFFENSIAKNLNIMYNYKNGVLPLIPRKVVLLSYGQENKREVSERL